MSTLQYDITDFPNDKFNAGILTREVDDADLSVDLLSIDRDGDTVTFDFDGTPTSGDETALDAVVAAHAGADFMVFPQTDLDEDLESDDSGDPIVRASLSLEAMQAGVYLFVWYQELAVTTETGNTGARGVFSVAKNGGSAVERGESNVGTDQFIAMSGSFPVTVDDGDDYDLELIYKRIGTSGNAARSRRARLAVAKLS